MPTGSNGAPKATDNPMPDIERESKMDNPSGASYKVEYILNLKFNAEDGSDIPLYNNGIELVSSGSLERAATFKRTWGDEMNMDEEDYWLFGVNLREARMDFTIGGDEPCRGNSNPNWKGFNGTGDRKITLTDMKESPYITSTVEFNLEPNRVVAIRAPKASNPAITIIGQGDYAAISWVGLFVKHCDEHTNQFVAVKTSCRLLPKYADRIRDDRGFNMDWGADVTHRSITLFSKQLFGTEGTNQQTYDRHSKESRGSATRTHGTITGLSLLAAMAKKWKALTGINIGEVRAQTASGSPWDGAFLDAAAGVSEIAKGFDDDKNDPDILGLITVVARLGQAAWERQKVENGEEVEKMQVMNTIDLDEIVKKIANSTLEAKDFGTENM
ncbi:hypothetical protein V498_02379 [Pseudogymnoascus sp. VKM F-4517 (FW-2822)]|nr:hypothetical protein V498_02379 [Pseudogymnoascus sp. VKM F-4517 (FW-2822)]